MAQVSVVCLLVCLSLVGKVVAGRYPSALGGGSVGIEEPRQVRSRSDFPEGFIFGTSSAAYQACPHILISNWVNRENDVFCSR